MQKWSQNCSQNQTKIDEKVVPTALPQNTPHFDNICLTFLLFVKKPIATKYCKYQCKTMICASPLDAQKSSQIGVRRPPKHTSEMYVKKIMANMLQKWCQRGSQEPPLEAQNQKSREVRGAIWRPDGVPSLLGAKSGPKITSGPQN